MTGRRKRQQAKQAKQAQGMEPFLLFLQTSFASNLMNERKCKQALAH
jgi:hypothetical protein